MNIFLGIISGVIVLLGQWICRSALDYRHFHDIAGEYEVLKIHAEKTQRPDQLTGEIVKLTERKGSTFKSECIRADGFPVWIGVITMNKEFHNFGQGIYQYANRNDVGTHQIQRHSQSGSICVAGANTSHPDRAVFNTLWRKRS